MMITVRPEGREEVDDSDAKNTAKGGVDMGGE